jgi:hypothetical protein
LRRRPDPYEKFKEIAKEANAGRVKLAEPWESLRMLIMPKPSEEREAYAGKGKAYRELDDEKEEGPLLRRLALEEAFGVYRTALREYAEGLKGGAEGGGGRGPFKRVVYVADLGQLKQLAEEEEAAFEKP